MITHLAVENVFNEGLGQLYQTRLVGGADEPFYEAPKTNQSTAIIWYRSDYVRSALHELSHWCVAGPKRRSQNDYGYWYVPDGRTREQQQLFFQVELYPQAIESLFCAALKIPFEVSVDNLNGGQVGEEVSAFRDAVNAKAQSLVRAELGSRASKLIRNFEALVATPREHEGAVWVGR